MKNVLKSLVLVCLAVAITLPLAAQDAKKKKKKGNANKARQTAFGNYVKQLSAKVDLTEEQTAKIKKLQSEAQPKLAEANKVVGKKRRELGAARKKAVADGKKGKAAQAAAEEAVGLTAEEKAALAKTREIQQGFQKAVLALLTPEQRKKAAPNRGGKKKKKKKKKDA
ncbi:MAG TPA: Spy/CpxP family protein refolding chaperone [Pirellulaceae bacterium]|jgi:Spy/CpxP family protein refolding chaperone|nr:Spy/CpxP family protein refolding chaperone [Pirellulaceae bacterium]